MLKHLPALALRDATSAAITVALWMWTLHTGAAHDAQTVTLHLVTALFTVLAGYLVHEWGHLLGALYAHGVVHLPPTPLATFLFRFDTVRNTRAQFTAMSLGGFIASVLAVALLLWLLPFQLLASRVALALVALGVIATFILEVPSAWRVHRGAPMPQGAAFVSTPQ
ncbi:MAG TPA: hypothetical protein VHE37_13480 [Nevskiaceae bacterium]|nr:hypothetical protein [Nevskiaceae bacterium]